MIFMSDEISTVDDLVLQHAAKQKEDTSGKVPEKEEKKVEVPIKKEDPPPVANPLDDLLKEYNLESVDALKERLKPKEVKKDEPESPEEKERRENVYRANLQNFAVENGIMNPDDFVKMENLKAKADRDLVYEEFSAEKKEDDPDLSDEEIREKFENKYDLNSDNAKAKTRGEAKLKKEADAMRNPYENSFKTAKVKFDEERSIRANYPSYDKAVRGYVNESIPSKFEVFSSKDGEENVVVDVDLTADDKKEIAENVAKKIQNPVTYSQYTKGELDGLKKLAKEETDKFIWEKYREPGLKKIAATYEARGVKKGSTVGATNPFPLVKSLDKTGTKGTQSAESEVLDSLQNKS